MRAIVVALAVAACGGPRAEPPRNVAPPSSRVRVAPTDPLGWIALAPATDRARAAYVPTAALPLVLPDAPAALTAGTQVSAIGARGGVTTFTAGAPAAIPFGCDGTTLEVTPFAGPRLPPGPAWILPPGAPSTWAPRALAIRVTASTPDHARFELGVLAIDLARTAPDRGRLTLTRAGRPMYTAAFSREPMDGVDAADLALDLAERDGPGIPSPVAAWSIAPGGPALVVLHTPSWEGSNLTALLVDDDGARPVDSLAHYLYRCAF